MDDGLEAAIRSVGPERLFARVRAAGWTEEAPPKWVWWMAVAELMKEDAAKEQS